MLDLPNSDKFNPFAESFLQKNQFCVPVITRNLEEVSLSNLKEDNVKIFSFAQKKFSTSLNPEPNQENKPNENIISEIKLGLFIGATIGTAAGLGNISSNMEAVDVMHAMAICILGGSVIGAIGLPLLRVAEKV